MIPELVITISGIRIQTPRVSDGFLPVAARRGFWYT